MHEHQSLPAELNPVPVLFGPRQTILRMLGLQAAWRRFDTFGPLVPYADVLGQSRIRRFPLSYIQRLAAYEQGCAEDDTISFAKIHENFRRQNLDVLPLQNTMDAFAYHIAQNTLDKRVRTAILARMLGYSNRHTVVPWFKNHAKELELRNGNWPDFATISAEAAFGSVGLVTATSIKPQPNPES